MNDKKRMVIAFRKYSRLGLSSPDLDAFSAYRRIRGCSSNLEDAYELASVYDTLRFLRLSGETESIEALFAVYFCGADKPLRKNDVSYRVQRFAIEHSCDARTVYRRLARVYGVYSVILSDHRRARRGDR